MNYKIRIINYEFESRTYFGEEKNNILSIQHQQVVIEPAVTDGIEVTCTVSVADHHHHHNH